MNTYEYTAIDLKGQRQSGNVAASSAREARDILRARRLTPVNVDPAKKQRASTSPASRKVKHKDLTQATRQLAILIDAATPVEEALRVVAVQFDGPMHRVLMDVRAQVLEGARLSEGLKLYPKAFSSLYRAMVNSGETSGKLAAVMERLALDLEAAQKIRRRILSATVYPMVLSGVAIIVVMILMVFVVPKVVEQFETFGQTLPPLTRGVIALSEFLQSYGLFVLAAIVIGAVAFRQALKQAAFQHRWHGFVLRWPLIGRLIRDLNAARFSRTMAGLIDSGTPALTAMETARYTLRNAVMRDAAKDAAVKVREGAAVSKALRSSEVFPPLVTQMVAGGEASGDIGKMFAKSADYLEDEFDSATSVFLSLLEPGIIILLGLVVLLIIGAIFLPILQLNTMAV